MIQKIALPKLDANITEATIGHWYKVEGETVSKGEVLADVITDKANFELTAGADGVLRKIIAPEKSQVPLGYVVALVGDAEDELPDVSAENDELMSQYLASVTGKALAAPTEEAQKTAERAPGRTGRVRASPRARRLARELGIDLIRLQDATGVEVVTEEDVLKFKSQNTGLKE